MMLNQILGFWMPGPLELLIIFFVSLFIFVIPIAAVILIIISHQKRKEEIAKLRIDVEKIGDEFEKLRGRMEDDKEAGPSNKSG